MWIDGNLSIWRGSLYLHRENLSGAFLGMIALVTKKQDMGEDKTLVGQAIWGHYHLWFRPQALSSEIGLFWHSSMIAQTFSMGLVNDIELLFLVVFRDRRILDKRQQEILMQRGRNARWPDIENGWLWLSRIEFGDSRKRCTLKGDIESNVSFEHTHEYR